MRNLYRLADVRFQPRATSFSVPVLPVSPGDSIDGSSSSFLRSSSSTHSSSFFLKTRHLYISTQSLMLIRPAVYSTTSSPACGSLERCGFPCRTCLWHRWLQSIRSGEAERQEVY